MFLSIHAYQSPFQTVANRSGYQTILHGGYREGK